MEITPGQRWLLKDADGCPLGLDDLTVDRPAPEPGYWFMAETRQPEWVWRLRATAILREYDLAEGA